MKLTWDDENVSVFVTIVGSMATGTVSYRETWSQLTNLLHPKKQKQSKNLIEK